MMDVEAEGDLLVVVEDDLGLQRALGRLLRAAGFRHLLFTTAEDMECSDALPQAACLVLDIDLPGISGLHCYSQLSEPRPPVLFITAHDSPSMRRAIEQTGAHEVLIKPFRGTDLLARVKAAMARPRPSQKPDRSWQ